MDQKWILVILVFYQKMTLGVGEDITGTEGHQLDIKCKPSETGTMTIWFRVLDQSGVKFIGSFSSTGMVKTQSSFDKSIFSDSKMPQNVLILKSFNKDRDSGIYSCASLKGSELKFGPIIRLAAPKVAISTTKATIPQNKPCTTVTACSCPNSYNKEKTSPSTSCALIILGPLAGGCGLLLLLLIITILYCNRIRTRRCPHHHKRQPRKAPGKHEMTNRHI